MNSETATLFLSDDITARQGLISVVLRLHFSVVQDLILNVCLSLLQDLSRFIYYASIHSLACFNFSCVKWQFVYLIPLIHTLFSKTVISLRSEWNFIRKNYTCDHEELKKKNIWSCVVFYEIKFNMTTTLQLIYSMICHIVQTTVSSYTTR